MQFIFLPASLKFSAVWPLVDAVSFNLVVYPIPVVLGAISPRVRPFALLFPASKLSNVGRTIFKNFLAFSMLQIVNPITFVPLT
jgi:hypothetical protein